MRHGEPVGGVKYRGSLDDPLSEQGWQQMRNTLQRMLEDDQHWDHIISSPMLRCQQFAAEAARQLAVPLTIEPDLRELAFGDLEGLTPEQAWEQYPELLGNLWQDPENHTPPNGESYSGFCQRIDKALFKIIHQHPDGSLLIVAHGGVIRAALHNFLHLGASDSFKVDVPYASVTRFKAYRRSASEVDLALSFINRY